MFLFGLPCLYIQDDGIALYIVAAAVGLGLAWFVWHQIPGPDPREADLRDLARQHGLHYEIDLDGFRPACPVFHHGLKRKAVHIVHGDLDGRLVQLGDYEFQTQVSTTPLPVGARFHTHAFSYLQLQAPGAIFEAVVLRPRPATDLSESQLLRESEALIAEIGGTLVAVPDPDLDARYLLSTEDPAYAQALFTPEVVALLQRHPPVMLYFGAWGLTLILGERLWAIEEFSPALEFAGKLFAALPSKAFHREVE